MATFHAIAATSEAIRRLLADAAGASPFADVHFAVAQAHNFKVPTVDTVTLYLYRVGPSTIHRNLPPRSLPGGRQTRPPLPVDLHYLLTPWTTDAIRQQYLLAWCMRTVEDTPILPTGLLNAGNEDGTFRRTESVELILDGPTLQDVVNIWEALKPSVQGAPLSAAYVARLIAIESEETVATASPVQTREFAYGRAVER